MSHVDKAIVADTESLDGHADDQRVVARLIGKAVERVEDLRLLTGRGTFVDDVEKPGMLHAAILRSPIAHGRLLAVDAKAARALLGVHAVFTASDIPVPIPTIPIRLAPFPEFEAFRQPVIGVDRIRYSGEPLAVVVAESRAIAEDALELIDIEYDFLPPVAGQAAAIAGDCLLFERADSNVAVQYQGSFGDASRAFLEASYVRTETFKVHRHTAVPLETRGLVAEWNTESLHLTVTGATKVPYFNRRALAQMLGLEQSCVDLVEVDVGAGFGVRGEFYPEDFLIPFAAKTLGASVKWIEDRREHFLATNHSREIDCELSIACDQDGLISGLRGRVIADMGAYIRTNGGVVPAKAGQFLPGPYRIPNVSIEVLAVLTNKTPVGTYRGPGRFEANFFRERLLDLAAADLGLDPVEMRRRNLLVEADLPYSIGRLVPYESESAYDNGDYHVPFERCLQEIGWSNHAAHQGELIDGRRHGIGVACFVESGGAGPKENARIEIGLDGHATVSVGSAVLGQGLETVLTQIASDALDIDFDRIRLLHGSTTLLPEGFGTYHSRAVVMGGSAVLDAATRIREQMLKVASRLLKLPVAQLSVGRNAVISNADAPRHVRAGFDVLAQSALEGGQPLRAEGTFSNDRRTYSYGTHAARVAVDPGTGSVEVLDYVAVEDVGRMINPQIVHGQAVGAVVQGLGGVFLDHLVYDEDAQLLNASLADYLLPTATDFPNIRAITLELRPSPSNPLGAKGAGEGGIVAVAAAAANAVAAALGLNITELPLSPARVWQLGAHVAADDEAGGAPRTVDPSCKSPNAPAKVQ